MDVEVPVLAGYLNVPTQSGFSLNRISKKKPCHRYCLLFKSSKHGIERLEICDSKEDKNPRIITLENCVKITQEPSPHNLIQIVKKTGTLTLNTLTDDDLKDWVDALQTVAFRQKNSFVCQTVIEEDNDLYCSSFGNGLFIVTLIPSDTSIRCNIDPKEYMLNLTITELQLMMIEDVNVIIGKWPYRFIRKYGYRDGKFTFEAGRKCFTGEGVFTLDHTNPQEIFRCMSAKMKSMKKIMSGESVGSIQSNENQLSVAASMEAGSRSPLPPFTSNQHGNEFEINSVQSCATLRSLLSSNDSVNNFPTNMNNSCNITTSAIKKTPNKPPRKLPMTLDKQNMSSLAPVLSNSDKCNQLNCDKLKQFQNYEPVSVTTSVDANKSSGSSSTLVLSSLSPESLQKSNRAPDLPLRNESAKKAERDYESIETITDAWKTLGVDDIKHTENNCAPDNNDLMDFVRQRQQSHRENHSLKDAISTVKTPAVVDIDIGEGGTNYITSTATDVTYDRLDFLSPNNKTSSGYKTIVNVTSPMNRKCCTSTANDYELIASPDIQSFRKTDDNYLGYGVLRKSTTAFMNPAQILPANNNSQIMVPLTFSDSVDATKTTAKSNDSNLDHRTYNGINYTIVSKPKRV